LSTPEEAAAWLAAADEPDLAAGLGVLNRVLHSYRLASADPHVHGIGRRNALAARLGYGERGRHRLLQDYRRITWRARRAMERVFYGEGR